MEGMAEKPSNGGRKREFGKGRMGKCVCRSLIDNRIPAGRNGAHMKLKAMPSLGWTENGEDGEVNYHFFHPNPTVIDANLWYYEPEDEWLLDLTYCKGGSYYDGIPKDDILSPRWRHKGGGMTHHDAQYWAEAYIKPLLRNE